MISPNPVILGIVWSCCILHALFTLTSCQSTNKESHRVYSYTYHFQHNGTNPREFLQEILSGPDFTGDDRTVIKTISYPNLRGFVTKGVFPGGPPGGYNRISGFGSPRDITIDGIKKIVQDNIQRLPPPPPLPPIPPPPADLPGNFIKDNGPGDIVKEVVRPVDRDHVVRNVENFVRHTPVGKVVGQTETFSYNPPPVNNVVNNVEGFRKSEQIVSHDQRSRGHITQSFFRQNLNSNSQSGISRGNVFGQRISVNNGLNVNNEWWKNVRNVANNVRNVANHIGNLNSGHNRLNTVNVLQQNNNAYGRQGNRQPTNENFIPDLPPFDNSRPTHDGNFGHRDAPVHRANANVAPDKTNYNTPAHAGNYENRNVQVSHNNVNAANFEGNHNPHIHRNLNEINSPIVWDDNRNDDVVNTQSNYGNWGNRLNRNDHNVQIHENQNRNNYGPGNIRPFSNAHSGPLQNNPLSHQNPADFIKSTLESLVPGAKLLDIPPFTNDGNFGNPNGGGHQRVYGSDIITRGPNSFSRNTERGYHRTFETTSNNGYQQTRRWSTDDVKRLGADSSRVDFSKDFIDVFQDDYSSN